MNNEKGPTRETGLDTALDKSRIGTEASLNPPPPRNDDESSELVAEQAEDSSIDRSAVYPGAQTVRSLRGQARTRRVLGTVNIKQKMVK